MWQVIGSRRAARLAAPAMLVVAALASRPAAAWEASLGWALTDVGLHDDRGGLVVGLGARAPLLPAALDLAYGLEYVQKRGAQPTWFSDAGTGFTRADAEVTLHVVQPVVLLVAAVPLPLPQPYAGLSVALKLAEDWGVFPGEPSEEWGYKDIDFVVHVGLARRLGPLRLEVRYSRGLTDQLLADPTAAAAKAEDPLPGVDDPVVGARLSQWQASAAIAF